MEENFEEIGKELQTVDGTFIDSIADSLEIPKMTDEEADGLKEQEPIENKNEGGL